MAPMKRPAAAGEGSPQKRGRKADPVLAACKEISKAVDAADGLSDEVRSMMSGAVHACLTTPKEERHTFQERVIQMLAEILDGSAKQADGVVTELQAKVAETDNEKASREAAAAAAAETVTRQGEVLTAANTALSTASSEAAAASAALLEAQETQRTGDAGYAAAADKKAKLEAARATEYEALKTGTATAVKGTLKTLVKLGKEFGWDANLLAAAENTLGKSTADRGSFDGMVIQQIDDAFNSNIGLLTEVLQNGEQGKAERAARVAEASAASRTALEREQACMAELATEQGTLKTAEHNKKAADKAVKDFDKDMKKVADDLEAAKSTQSDCHDIVSSFRGLVERSAEQPEEPEAAAEPAAPVPEAPDPSTAVAAVA